MEQMRDHKAEINSNVRLPSDIQKIILEILGNLVNITFGICLGVIFAYVIIKVTMASQNEDKGWIESIFQVFRY